MLRTAHYVNGNNKYDINIFYIRCGISNVFRIQGWIGSVGTTDFKIFLSSDKHAQDFVYLLILKMRLFFILIYISVLMYRDMVGRYVAKSQVHSHPAD
jgi:hypothetical protein